MFIRAYLRASTKEQDAKRAKSELIAFANDHGVLGIFRPKTTKCSGGRAVRGLQRGITFR